ncbi:MAG: GNAT family N-acetyltransferase [Flavobacteriaceae bacterium]|nr:GNAT family N-acetyltransferase [Flavobacteriaceae bacterium]
MNPLIRKASAEDMPQVLELIEELAAFENEPDAVNVTVEVLQKEGFGDSPLFTCFVAEMDSEIVGMALVYFRFSTWKGRALHLEDLVVKESMRGSGIGEALYARVMKYAKDNHCKRVNWVVLDWNEGAIKFYERSGAHIDKSWWHVGMNEEGIRNYLKAKDNSN